MDERTAQKIVSVIAVLHSIVAGLAGLLAIIIGSTAFSGMARRDSLGELIAFVGIVLATIFALYAVLYGLTGYGLWKRRNWGRVLLVIISAIGVVMGVLSGFTLLGIVQSFIFHDAVALTGLLILGGISGLLLWLFGFQQDVVRVFGK